MRDYAKGGRGQKAPYTTTVIRIPTDLVPAVERMVNEYRKCKAGQEGIEQQEIPFKPVQQEEC